ncbi:AraC family transcriptional regulator ligand-binding domain-containing protein [Collimonas sp. NPDC087041]|uniref:AraC family transcriptional regulator n=1 Tax=Collimonas sp. NPDC087041 TaxID=3363960 RepID=UPI003811363F
MRKDEPNSSTQSFIPNAYVRLLFEYLEQHGLDAESILGQSSPTEIDDHMKRCPMGHWKSLVDRTAHYLDDPMLGFHLGQTIKTSHFGAAGYVLASCQNLGMATALMQQYKRLLYDASPTKVFVEGGDIVLQWGKDDSNDSRQQMHECTLASLVQFIRNITGQKISLTEISFINSAPLDVRPYNNFFDCIVLFEQPITALRAPLSLSNHQLCHTDSVLMHLLKKQLDDLLAKLPPKNEFETIVRQCIIRLIRDGEPELDNVANALHLTTRTLHRRLVEVGSNFRSLLDDVRQQMAEDFLHDTNLQLSDIAQLLGYAEQSTFQRAFRRWTGDTPLHYQQKIGGKFKPI